MIYCCEDCSFLFSRVGEVERCPFCEGTHFRQANEEEVRRLLEVLQQRKSGEKENTSKI